jgi:hypothetical protein
LSDRGCPELHGRRVAGRSLGPCRLDRLATHSIGTGGFAARQSIRVSGASGPLNHSSIDHFEPMLVAHCLCHHPTIGAANPQMSAFHCVRPQPITAEQ